MKLDVRHTFDRSPQEIWDLFQDPAFNAALAEGSPVIREVLSEEKDGDRTTVRARFTSVSDLPGPISAALGSRRITYEQVSVWNAAAHTSDWKILPGVAADRITAGGRMRLIPLPKGCERRIEGEIVVRIPLVGGRVEKAFADQLTRAYEDIYAKTVAWLARR